MVHHAPWLLAAALSGTFTQAQAQAQSQGSAGSGTRVVESFTVLETVTSNRDLSSTHPQADSITQLSPGISISSRSGRVQGSLSYTLSALIHARDSASNSLQNALDASVRAEAIPRHVYIDAKANVSQQTISAFGTQSSGLGLLNDNRTEVATASLSPSVRGRLGGVADVAAQVTWAGTNSASTDAGDSTSLSGSLSLGGRQGMFGWGLNASRQVVDFKASSKTTQDQAGASLSLVPDSTLRLVVRGGKETNDVETGSRASNDTWGWGADFSPSSRTRMSYQTDHRYFGKSYSLSFQHRMARSVWMYTDSRGVNGDPLASLTRGSMPIYDLLYSSQLFIDAYPDPALRDQQVRELLQRNKLDPSATITGNFLTTGLTLQRSQNLSLALSGLRSTITLAAFRTASSRLQQFVGFSDDLSQADQVRQLGFSAGVSHRLTADSSLALTATRLRTLDSGAQAGNDQRTAVLTLSGTLGPHSTGSLAARHTRFETSTQPYRESALIGSLSLQY
jgi:uncharacterized protein (PEP-CTERM system associated)